MKDKYRTRCLGGSLLVIKDLNDCVTIERGRNGKPHITRIEGDWNKDELESAMHRWDGSDAQRR